MKRYPLILSKRNAVLLLFTFQVFQGLAQDDIPNSDGFSGYILTGPGIFSVKSNLLVTGPPLIQDGGKETIESVFDAPSSKTALAFPFAGEINYTHAKSRTQFFFGNRLEDILRLDVPFGLGVRQELKDSSIMALSYLATPAELKFWADPYVEGTARERTILNFRGIRWRWGRILKTGLELTATVRWYEYDLEKSGNWLVEEGRLEDIEQQLLIRNGNVTRIQGLYRISLNQKHRLEPNLQLIFDNHKGDAMANDGFAAKLTYLYRTPKLLLDVNATYGQRNSKAIHPVYNQKIDPSRLGVAIMAFVPFQRSKTGLWSFWGGVEVFDEDSNIDFFDSQFTAFMAGVAWRHLKQ